MTDPLDLMKNALADYLWAFVVLVVIPVCIGRAMGATWREIVLAFAIVLALAALFGLTSSEKTWEMRATWAAIGFMIAALPGVPLVLFIMRLLR